MNKSTGVSLTLWASREELQNAKNGASTLVASKAKTKDADIQIIAALDACDILENEVRVNLTLLHQNIDNLGQIIGEAMGRELEKVIKSLE
ncbi:MAG: hypothetical protein K6T83_03680 [Alicyclobacillus sp.]|nr:hypothetical protein [Alicyclobacillus sp.]